MKQTEIGMIPDDWEVKELGKITTHVDYRGKTPHKTQHGIQLITAKNIRMGYIDYRNNQEFVSEKDYFEVMKRGLPHLGDVLITTEAPAGNVAQIDNENIALAQRVIKYSGKDCICNDYLCKYFLSNYFQSLLKSMNTGGTVQGIKGSLLHTLPVILPPTLAEQQKIAKALSDVDNVISTLEKLITKKKNLKQGTMQQLLTGKKRLPGFAPTVVEPVENTKFKQTEIGEIPEDWEVKEIGKILKIGHGRDYKNLKDGNVPVYGTGGYMISVNQYLYDGDTVCIGRKGTIDKPFYHEGKIWTVDTLFYTYDFKSVLPKFLYYKFCLIDWLSMNEASGVPSLTSKNIEDVVITLPSMPEQTAIANVLSSIDKEIEALNTKLEKYRNLKNGMMQQLLTGKIRLV